MNSSSHYFRGFSALIIVSLVVVFSFSLYPSLTYSSASSSSLTGGEGFLPTTIPKNPKDILLAVSQTDSELFTQSFLSENQTYFDEVAKKAVFMGDTQQAENLAMSMYQQWVYLELYRSLRLEYLLTAFSKTLALSNLVPYQAKVIFDSYLPKSYFAKYQRLNTKRQEVETWMLTQLGDKEEKRKAKEFYLGTLEAAYLTMAVLDAKEKHIKERFSGDQTDKELKKIEGWRSSLLMSSGLLTTKEFKKSVEPYYKKEVANAHQTKEAAIDNFRSEFSSFVSDQTTFSQLIDYFDNGSLLELGKQLAQALQTPDQLNFRKRIGIAFARGHEEVLKNQLAVLNDYKKQFGLDVDFRKGIITANAFSKDRNEGFGKWLIDVFQEQPIHWIIANEYPYLKKGLESLTGFVNRELSFQRKNRWTRYSLMTAVLIFTPLGKTNPSTQWLGKFIWVPRTAILGTQSYLSYTMIKDAWGAYQNWKKIRGLARLNLDGMGLTSLLQEENALFNLKVMASMALTSATMTSGTLSGQMGGIKFARNLGGIRQIKHAASGAANGYARSMGRYSQHMWLHSQQAVGRMKEALKALVARNFVKAAGLGGKVIVTNARMLAIDSASILTQLVVTMGTSTFAPVRELLTKLQSGIFQGIILGSVMGVMGVTVQHYVNAAGLRAIVWGWEEMGYVTPTLWQVNKLNSAYKTKRNAFLGNWANLNNTINTINVQANITTACESYMNQPTANLKTKFDCESQIEAAKIVIKNRLLGELGHWYFDTEYREINNSSMKLLGFGIIAEPNMEDPVSLTIMLKLGPKVYQEHTSVHQLVEWRDRNTLPTLNLSDEEQKQTFEALTLGAQY